MSSRFAACMRKITPTFICTPKRNSDRNLLLSTETNATNTNGFRCLQEIMKQVSQQMLKYSSSFATSFIQNEIRW